MKRKSGGIAEPTSVPCREKSFNPLKKIGVNNPVFCLDEVDKMSMDFRGDPSAALLEVLDPEQNYSFNDHYLDLDYDLSDILFITTANTLPDIPLPLQDRMEIIRLPGYTGELKNIILPIRLSGSKADQSQMGLRDSRVLFRKASIYTIIRAIYPRSRGAKSGKGNLIHLPKDCAGSVKKRHHEKDYRISSKIRFTNISGPTYQIRSD